MLAACAIVLGIVVTAATGSQAPQEGGVEPSLTPAVEVNNRFALGTYRRATGNRGNVVFSPGSIRAALQLVHEGAAGPTQEELTEILRAGAETSPRASETLRLAVRLARDGNAHGELRLATALWAQEGANLRRDCLDRMRAQPDVRVEAVDFHGDAVATCARLNEWTQAHTGGLIEGGWVPERIDPRTDLVLTSAFLFHANWERVFGSRGLSPWIDEGTGISVAMMGKDDGWRYYADPRLEAAVIPYEGGRFSMLALLPRTPAVELADLERDLTPAHLARILGEATEQACKLVMPRFEIRSRVDLAGVLGPNGPPRLFRRGAADLSPLTSDAHAFVGVMDHEAHIQVNELGTKVAANTRVIFYRGPPPPPKPELRLDHPFFFAIVHEATGAILALGRLVQPGDRPPGHLPPTPGADR